MQKKNYEKNKNSFVELKNKIVINKPNIFSFGCGIGLVYLGAKEVFEDINYFGIDECDWEIKKTENYKNFEPRIPKTMKFDEGIFLLSICRENVVICFFNSLFTIASNTENLQEQLTRALSSKKNFYIVCDFTINSTYHMPKEEMNFLNRLIKALNNNFKFKHFEILSGDGIIIYGENK